MDVNADIPTIKTEPVAHEEDAVEVLQTEIDIEYTDIKKECLTQCSHNNQAAGRENLFRNILIN